MMMNSTRLPEPCKVKKSLKEAVQIQYEVNWPDDDGWKIFHIALKYGKNMEIFSFFIDSFISCL